MSDSVRASRGRAGANRVGVVPQVAFELGLKQESEAATAVLGPVFEGPEPLEPWQIEQVEQVQGGPCSEHRVDRTRGQCKPCRPQ